MSQTNPALWKEYQEALHAAESTSRFLRGSGQYPLTGRGRINTYSVFAERMRRLLKPGGRAGIIIPTGIATDDTNKHFFADLVEKGALVSLFDFENREKIFPAVDSRYKFCLLTLRGEKRAVSSEQRAENLPLTAGRSSLADSAAGRSPLASFCFFATRAEHLRDPRRVFQLSAEDIARINPNTRTLPVFRTRQDAELTKAIYRRVPVLVNERITNSEWRMEAGESPFATSHSPFAKSNPWDVRFRQGLFNMSSDSHLFRTREQLEKEGFRLVGNVMVKGAPHSPFAIRYLPLYEAKMIWHYDHRFGTYEGVTSRSSTHLPTLDETQHADPNFLVQPWYWVPAEEVDARLGDWRRGWLLGFRDVTNATNERTAIFSLLPRMGVGHKAPLIFSGSQSSALVAAWLANLSSLVFDFVTRQKIGGTSFGFFILCQLPVLPPDAYTPEDLRFIVPRVLELVYTAWDLKPFADEVWNEADEPLRTAILEQWKENRTETGGCSFDLPAWAQAYPEITPPHRSPLAARRSPHCPFPPFKWDETRRARLRAELDAYYARLYGLTRKQLRYILDPADLTEKELADILDPWEEVEDPLDPDGYTARTAASDFPGETFRVLKEKEIHKYGEYRTRRLVLEAWERLSDLTKVFT